MSRSTLLKVLATVVVTGAGVYLYPPLRLSALVLAGRSPDCPLAQALKAEDNLGWMISTKDRILAASKLIEKDGKGFQLWETPKGRFWVPDGNEFMLPWNLAEEERKAYGKPPHFVRAGEVVLDCGANLGIFTREALAAGAGKVVAIEPAPENLEALRRNLREEIASGKVIVYPKGVWDKDEWLTLNQDAGNTAADSFVLHPPGAKTSAEKFPLTTIDKMVAELGLERVDFIKMDIEGAEPRAMKGARQTLARWRPRMSIAVYHQASDPVTVPRAAREGWAGYSVECGPCASRGGRIWPEIFYFR